MCLVPGWDYDLLSIGFPVFGSESIAKGSKPSNPLHIFDEKNLAPNAKTLQFAG